jgi:radical SAM superfamily enzyme YgiQ (UPF0313 family)
VAEEVDKERVLLVNPNSMKPVVAPIALDYLACALKKSGFAVDVLDLCLITDFVEAINNYFASVQPLAIGFSIRNTDDTVFTSQDFFIPEFKQVIDHIKARTDAPLILGGSGFSIMPEAILRYCDLDLGIWGEGEYSLSLLVERLASNQDYGDVPALVYRSNNKFHRNPAKYLNLTEMAAPKREAVNNIRYFLEGGMGNVEDKRGCPGKCIYCADPLGKGSLLRLRSPQSVVEEMEALLALGIDYFHFCDNEFNLPESHAREVCLKMIERGLGEKVRWYAYCSPVPFCDDLAVLFRKAGCAGIDFGVDSGCDRMLRALGRDFTVDDIKRTAEVCHRQGIVFMYDLLLGGPGETRESLRETIEVMKRASPNRVGTTIGIRTFPGTKLAQMAQKEALLAQNPNLHGTIQGNEDFFFPIFYLSSALGAEASDYLAQLIGKDERFFFAATGDAEQNYNYNENTILVDAIKAGYRGAFWDILRRLAEGTD